MRVPCAQPALPALPASAFGPSFQSSADSHQTPWHLSFYREASSWPRLLGDRDHILFTSTANTGQWHPEPVGH